MFKFYYVSIIDRTNGGCRTLQTFKTLISDQVALKTLKNKYFSVENLENLETGKKIFGRHPGISFSVLSG